MKHKQGVYLRFRVSPKTISEVVNVGGKIAETAIGINSVRVGLKIKKAAEQQAKIAATLKTGKDIADITSGIATAVTKLIQ